MSFKKYCAKLDGKKVVPLDNMEEWALSQAQNKTVLKTKIHQGAVEVSTVFLGLNHGSCGKDLWFETMVFGCDNDILERYETWEEAEKGHWEIFDKMIGMKLVTRLCNE